MPSSQQASRSTIHFSTVQGHVWSHGKFSYGNMQKKPKTVSHFKKPSFFVSPLAITLRATIFVREPLEPMVSTPGMKPGECTNAKPVCGYRTRRSQRRSGLDPAFATGLASYSTPNLLRWLGTRPKNASAKIDFFPSLSEVSVTVLREDLIAR